MAHRVKQDEYDPQSFMCLKFAYNRRPHISKVRITGVIYIQRNIRHAGTFNKISAA